MRILAIASTSFSAAVFCALYGKGLASAVAAAIAFSLLCAYCLLKKPKHRVRTALIALFSASAGLLWPGLYASYTVDPARELDGQTIDCAVLLTSYPSAGKSVSLADGVLATEGFPSLGVRIYDSTYSLSSAVPGQLVVLNARLKSAETRYGEEYNGYLASGIQLIASAKGRVVPGSVSFSPRFWPVQAKQLLLRKISEVFRPDAAPFMKSLMLGEKGDFYADPSLETAMSRSGLMHVIAVSGMHLSFLVGFVQLAFGRNRRSSLVCLGLIWFFVFMTGSPPSAMRAGLMQSFVLCAPLFGRENDAFTSLSFSLAVLLLLNPFSAKSAGLQLSFAAVTGLMLFSRPLYQAVEGLFGSGMRIPPVKAAAGVLASSLSVMALTVPVTALQFGSVQILAPVTNMLVLWSVSLCFCLGYLACLAACFLPAFGSVLAFPAVLFMRLITGCAGLIAKIPFSSLYTCSDFALWWVLGVYLAVFVFYLLPVSKKLKLLVPLTGAILSLALLLVFTRVRYNRYPGVFSAVDVGQGACVTVFSGEDTLMIDCGGILSADNAGEAAGRYLLSCGREDVDLLVLTHLHDDHINGVPVLLEYLPVREIAIPKAAVDEDGLLQSILDAAESHHTPVTYLEDHAEASLGRIHVQMAAPVTSGDANDRCLISVVSVGNYEMLVTGDAPASAERLFLSEADLSGIGLYVAGHHGSKTSSCAELLAALPRSAEVVISSGYNTFGHPSPETLKALSVFSAVHRTDREGTVQFILREG